jgi:hypothetical protein
MVKTSHGATSPALPYIVSLVAGFAICMAIRQVSGRLEMWDSSLYFVAGIPLMCIVTFALAYAYPLRAWRWVVSMAVGQSIVLLMAGSSLTLWPLTLVAMMILSLPQLAVAIAASRLSQRRRATPQR